LQIYTTRNIHQADARLIADFEPIQDDKESTPVRQLADYEEYIRRELPRLVQARLEETINFTNLPIEGAIRDKFINIIREAQDRVFANYTAKANSRGDPETTTSKATLRDHNNVANEQNSLTPLASIDSEWVFQPPPPLAGHFQSLDLADLASDHHTSKSDSAYMSEIHLDWERDGTQELTQASMGLGASIDKDSRAPSTIIPEMATNRSLETTMPYPKPRPMGSPAQDAN
jgi:hypothetical protein